MARPKNTGAEWFDYSVHTLSDPKIDILRIKHGADGFLFYMYMLEQIYRTEFYELDLGHDTDYLVEYFSLKMCISSEKFKEILETCFKVNLFDRKIYDETKHITSNGVKKRAIAIEEKREYDRKRYEKNKKSKDSFHSENNVEKSENKMKNSENNVNSQVSTEFPQDFHNKRIEENRTEEKRREQNRTEHHQKDSKIRFAEDCGTSSADDDFLRSDFQNENGCGASSADEKSEFEYRKVSEFTTPKIEKKKSPAEMVKSGEVLENGEYCEIQKRYCPDSGYILSLPTGD